MARNPWISHHKHTQKTSAQREGGAEQSDQQSPAAERTSYAEEFCSSPDSSQGKSNPPDSTAKQSSREKFLQNVSCPKENTARFGKNASEQPKTESPRSNPSSGSHTELREKLENRRAAMPQAHLPALPEKAHRQFNRNFTEFSLAESNLRALGQTACTVYCTSCFRKEGKTTSAVGIAFGLSEFGQCNVLLIDSNYEQPQLGRVFNVQEKPGLQQLLADTAKPEDTILPTAYPHLYLLTAGEGTKLSVDAEFSKLLTEFKSNFDFVLIDGKALFASAEATNITAVMDAFLMIVKCEETKWEVVQLAYDKLKKSGTEQGGIVLNQRRYYLPKLIYRLISRR